MDNIAGSQADGDEQESSLVNVTSMPLTQLLPSDDSVLANSLRRLLAEMDHPQDIIAAFQNAP